MNDTRRRSDRPGPARGRFGSSLETLERRELLANGAGSRLHALFHARELPVPTVQRQTPPVSQRDFVGVNAGRLAKLSNDGKVLTGRDRQGDTWIIRVNGPGVVIVTDATPNDGVLDDDLATIQLVGTDINRTHVTGGVSSSNQILTDGQVLFNKLIATSGVASIALNGFVLSQTVTPPAGGFPNSDTSIYLGGGVKELAFAGIDASIDQSQGSVPINITIGDPSTPLTVQPSIRISRINNTVFDSSSTTPPTGPQTLPTVNLIVNGEIKSLDLNSVGKAATLPTLDFITANINPNALGDINLNSPNAKAQFAPALEVLFPTVGSTGRTSVQATGIGKLKVTGGARNLTASRQAIPFQTAFSGLSKLDSAEFGGTADGVALDVGGKVGKLRFARGLGDPNGSNNVPPNYGFPAEQVGYPGTGRLGGVIRANKIGKIRAGAANTILQTAQNPNDIQQTIDGETTYFARPGNALTNSAIVSAGSIDSVEITGNLSQSEIKAGFDYRAYLAGLEGTRGASSINSIDVKGDLVNSVVSSTYRPVNTVYGDSDDVAGNGRIKGRQRGSLYNTGAQTALGNTGAGFFARSKGDLAPPEGPKRLNNVLIRKAR